MSVLSYIQGKRFLNRRLRNLLPESYPFKVHQDLEVFLETKDLSGPSFFIAYGGPAAFYFYEEKVKSEILKALPADGTFFDLGANIGIHTWFIANHFRRAKIYAFEPDETLQRCIQSSIERNGFENVRLIPFAVGERESTLAFWRDPKSSGGNSLVPESIPGTPVRAKDVNVVSLDSFTAKNGIERVDVIKIDVQDGEDLVLAGAKELIARCLPTMVIESTTAKIAQGKGAVFELPSRYEFREAGQADFLPLDQLPRVAAKRSADGRLQVDFVFRAV